MKQRTLITATIGLIVILAVTGCSDSASSGQAGQKTAGAAGRAVDNGSGAPVAAPVAVDPHSMPTDFGVHITVADTTKSVAGQFDSITVAMKRDAESAAHAAGGHGALFVAGSIGGGPSDVRLSEPVDLTCRGSRHQCSDPIEIANRTAMGEVVVDAARTPSEVPGSDPIGATFSVLRTAKAEYGDREINLTLYTDGASNGDRGLEADLDLTDPNVRAGLLNDLAVAGFDFSTVGFHNAHITVVLIGGDFTGPSSAAYEGTRQLYEELLGATGADVKVVSLATAVSS